MSFRDREDAGDRLAARLEPYAGKDVVVLALPRGGVEVAAPIARRLGAPLDLLLVRKIGTPGNPELAMGAIIDGDHPVIVRNDEIVEGYRISEAEFAKVADKELAEIERRRTCYLAGRPPVPLSGRIAIVVDDGIATGATFRAALGGLRKKKPSRIVVAVPVAPVDVVEELRGEVDELICLEPLSGLGAVGLHYQRFDQLSDQDVIDFLAAGASGR
jgi:predicted phosphoribosyltransferase